MHAQKFKRKHSFPIRVVSLWNSLPEKIALAPTLNQFKSTTGISATARNYTTLPWWAPGDEPLPPGPLEVT